MEERAFQNPAASRRGPAQNLESVEHMASGIAHEFNNILTIIQGYTTLLLTQRQLPPDVAEPIEMIAKVSERAAFLTRQLQTFSRTQELHSATLDLNELINSL